MPVASGGDSNGAEVAENETVEVEGLEALAHKPLLLFAEQRPWGSATGPDVPTIALYEDGLAIVHKGEPPAVRALTARAPNEVRALVERILTPQFLSLPARFSTSQAADQPTVSILVRNGARWKLAAV